MTPDEKFGLFVSSLFLGVPALFLLLGFIGSRIEKREMRMDLMRRALNKAMADREQRGLPPHERCICAACAAWRRHYAGRLDQ